MQHPVILDKNFDQFHQDFSVFNPDDIVFSHGIRLSHLIKHGKVALQPVTEVFALRIDWFRP